MRKIITSNSQVEFHEISNDGVILNIKAFQYGVLHYQIKNGKVVFYSNADENPWRNEVWSVDMPVTIDDEVYSTLDEVAEALSAVMNDSYQEQLDELQDGLATEEGRAQAAEEALQTAIENETSRAQAAETNLQSEITSVSATVATFDGRITNVENGLSALTETVNDEITRSTAKDAEHDAEISGLTTSLQNEITRAQGAESALTNSLNNEIARATSAETVLHNEILAERDRALAAENAIDDKVDAEVSRSTAKDSEHDTAISGLNTSIQNEITRATSAETVLHDEILSERDRALAAESGITANLNAEISRATARENAIDDKVDAEVSRSTAKDASQDALISGLTTSLQNEINRATSAENSLRSDLNAEISRAHNAETALDAKIDAEIGDRINAISGLNNSLNTEISRATNAETALNEKVNAVSAYNASQDAQIEAVSNSLNTEISRATSVENALRSDLNTETSARTAADTAQIERIVALEVGKANKSEVYTKVESDAKYATKDYVSGLTDNFYTKGQTNELLAAKADKAAAVASAEYVSSTKKINFKNIDGAIISEVDATAFIKDGMVDNVEIVNNNLVITFNTDSGKEPISIPLSDIFNPENYYTKTEVDASQNAQNSKINEISGKTDNVITDVQTLSGEVQTISGKVDDMKTYVGGRGITIASGQTADTISFNLPISAGTGSNSIIEGYGTQANGSYSHAEGLVTQANGSYSHAEGKYTSAATPYSFVCGLNGITSGDSVILRDTNTIFAVGNGYDNTHKTTKIHNALEVKLNGDIYIADTNNTSTTDYYDKPMIKLQDAIGQGGGGVTPTEVQTMIDESISGKTNQSDFIAHTASTSIHVTSSEKQLWNNKSDFSGNYNDLTNKLSAGTNVSITNNVISATDTTYSAGDGIDITNNVISTVTKFWCGTQQQYDAISVKDPNTVYMIHE